MGLNLKIMGSGMTVDQDITLTQAGKIIAFLGSESEMTDAPTIGGQLIHAGVATIEHEPAASARLSVREMIDEAKPNTHAQRITVFGHFVAQGHPDGFFTNDEVKEQYQLAREKLTLHFSREVDKAISTGWIEPVRGEKNTFFVTRKGEDAVANAFNNSGKVRAKAKPAGTKSATISEDDVSEAVRNVQPVLPTLPGYPNYHKLKSKGLKIMWLLAMAEKQGIDRLSTKELAFFAGKLRDKLEIRDISGHTVTGAKNGWVTKDNAANYSLLHDGEEHLKSLTDEDAAN
jgi:hypothetical protein